MPFLTEILSQEAVRIPEETLAYFHARLKNRWHDYVIRELLRQKAIGNREVNHSALAKRLGCRPEQITRWLGAPGNWTTETQSNLLLAIGAAEPPVGAEPLSALPRNYNGPDWVSTLRSVDETEPMKSGSSKKDGAAPSFQIKAAAAQVPGVSHIAYGQSSTTGV